MVYINPQFFESIIPHPNQKKGDFNTAADLINTTNLHNEEIALKSGVSKAEIPRLRRKILKYGIENIRSW